MRAHMSRVDVLKAIGDLVRDGAIPIPLWPNALQQVSGRVAYKRSIPIEVGIGRACVGASEWVWMQVCASVGVLGPNRGPILRI
jgi:hypothetical protein